MKAKPNAFANIGKITILLSLIIQLTTSMFLVLESWEKRCITKHLKGNHQFTGSYFISGEEEDKNLVFITGPENSRVWESRNHKEGAFHIGVREDGEYSLCFLSEYDKELTVSFDFHDEKKAEELISVQSIENLNQVVHQVRRKMDIIHSNMRNSLIRRATHVESKYCLFNYACIYCV